MAEQEESLPPNTIRVTTLLKSTREILLTQRHWDEIEQDVSDMIWLLFGTAVHSILEAQPEQDTEFKEERLTNPFQIRDKTYNVSGKFDLFDYAKKEITDYKTTSVWKVIHQDFDDYRKQMLIYAYLLRLIGIDAKRGTVVMILKDHKKSSAKTELSYPAYPIAEKTFEFDDADFANIAEFVENKLIDIYNNEEVPDDELPLCTSDERWNSGTVYKVMKKGSKRSSKNFYESKGESRIQAEMYKEEHGLSHVIVEYGKDNKCEDYCLAAPYCNQYKSKQEGRKA